MKRFVGLLLAALLLMGAALAGAETLRVGMECNYAPFNWTQAAPSEFAVPLAGGGYADGYDVQVAKLIAKELGMELEIVKTEWDGLPPALLSGQIDAIIAGMSPTAERKLTIAFTASYYDSDLGIVVKKDGPYASASSLKDFSGAKITGQLNTLHYTVIDQIPGVSKQTALDTFSTMIVALAAGRVDGYVSARPGAISAMLSNPEFSFVSFEDGQGFETTAEDTQVAVGLQHGSPLLDTINAVLEGLSLEARDEIMTAVIARQPLSEE